MKRLLFITIICAMSCETKTHQDKSMKELEHELDSLKRDQEVIDAVASMDTIKNDLSQEDSEPIIRKR